MAVNFIVQNGRRPCTGRLAYRAELYGRNASLFNRFDDPGIRQVLSDLPPVNSGPLDTFFWAATFKRIPEDSSPFS